MTKIELKLKTFPAKIHLLSAALLARLCVVFYLLIYYSYKHINTNKIGVLF